MRKGKISNIQKKYLTYTLLLLALTIILSSVGVWIFMRKNMTEVIVDNYVFINEKMGMTLDYLYTRSDETTAECILDDAVQDSLKSRELEEVEKNALSKYFAYLELEDIEEYCYVNLRRNKMVSGQGHSLRHRRRSAVYREICKEHGVFP